MGRRGYLRQRNGCEIRRPLGIRILFHKARILKESMSVILSEAILKGWLGKVGAHAKWWRGTG